MTSEGKVKFDLGFVQIPRNGGFGKIRAGEILLSAHKGEKKMLKRELSEEVWT